MVEHRFGSINQLPSPIERLNNNGSCYTAGNTRRFARAIGLDPRTTPLQSPQSNRMAQAFVLTFKRENVCVSVICNTQIVLRCPSGLFIRYNQVYAHNETCARVVLKCGVDV